MTSGPPRSCLTPNYRFREIGSGIFISNEIGLWAFITQEEHRRLCDGESIAPDRESELLRQCLLRDADDISRYRELKAQWESCDPTGKSILVIVHLTQRCNLTCGYCHSAAVPLSATHKDLDPDLIRRVCDFIASRPEPKIQIAFQGGEPLLCLDTLESICEGLAPLGKQIGYSVTTNGTYVSDQYIDLIKKYPIETTISFDGPKDVHDSIRKDPSGEGSYDAAIRARELIKSSVPSKRIGVIMVLGQHNVGRVRDIVDLYETFDKSIIRLKPITRLGRAGSLKIWGGLGLSFEEYWAAYVEGVRYMKEKFYRGDALMCEYDIFIFLRKLIEHVNVGDVDSRNPCGVGTGVLNIDSSGVVSACHEFKHAKDFRVGDVRESPSVDGKMIAKLRSTFNDMHTDPICRSCAYLAYCMPCPAHNFQQFGMTSMRPNESWECRKTLAVGDHVLSDFEANSEYYLAVWKRHRLSQEIASVAIE